MEYFKATLAKFMNAPPVDSSAISEPNKKHLLNVHRPIPRISYASSSTACTDPRANSTLSSSSSSEDIVKIQKIALSLCSALCILRKEGIIHADIKPENIFINWKDSLSASFRHSLDPEFCSLQNLPDNFEVRLGTSLYLYLMLNNSFLLCNTLFVFLINNEGDFGNALQVSEVSEYFESFEIQTLVYRAPEVLLGVPFNQQIDMFSLGLVLLELWTAQPFFVARSREELYASLCRQLTPPPRQHFSYGKFFDTLESSYVGGRTTRTFSVSEHVKAVKRAMSKNRGDCTPQLVHFIALLLHPDPIERLSPFEALKVAILLKI
jgi:serine/threonine protein kinase